MPEPTRTRMMAKEEAIKLIVRSEHITVSTFYVEFLSRKVKEELSWSDAMQALADLNDEIGENQLEKPVILVFTILGAPDRSKALDLQCRCLQQRLGWAATYWVKHVTNISAVTKPFDGFWMKTAYRIPVGKFALVTHFISQETAANTPVTDMVANSLITSPADGARIAAGRRASISGIAWDGGYGISVVEISEDNGKSWTEAPLGEDHGKYAFRTWSYEFTPKQRGKLSFATRATNKIGQTQTNELIQNPAGSNRDARFRVRKLSCDGS